LIAATRIMKKMAASRDTDSAPDAEQKNTDGISLKRNTPQRWRRGRVFVLYGLPPPQKGVAGDAMITQDDFDSQLDLDDDASNGGTLPNPFDSEREKLLREWVDRFDEVNECDHNSSTAFAAQRWKATHVREQVALPNRRTYEVELCAVYLRPMRGSTFTTTDLKFARFANWSNFVLRRLQRSDGAHRGYTLDEIPDDDDERFLLDGVIPAAQLAVIYGAPKHGKSAWAHKLAVAVASNDLAFDGLPVEHGRVLFVTLDPGARRVQVKRRIAAVCERMGVPNVMENKRIVLVDDVVFLDDVQSVDHFLQRNPGKFALVIIDPLYKALTSGDPSIAGQMTNATEGMKQIIAATGAALLIVHHATKSKGEMYGSVFLDAALDARLYVERVSDVVTVTVEVVKNGEPSERPFTYRFEKEFLAPLADGSRKVRDDEPKSVTRADMLALMPLTPMLIREARKLIEHMLTGKPAAREQQWARARASWQKVGLVVQTEMPRTIRRVAP
jgi:hypothetical protein